jgi:CRISPR type I-E-associated protein CasB/Cse2
MTLTPERVREYADRLVSRLEGWHREQDRGPLARLRRGLSEATQHEAWTVLGACFGDVAVGHPVFQTVAGCFALHPVDWAGVAAGKRQAVPNFGGTMREILLGAEKEDSKRYEKLQSVKEPHTRFRRLLACGAREEICEHIRHAVRLAASREVPVNYRKLFEDLWWWNEHVKVEWAKSYWQAPAEPVPSLLAGTGTPPPDESPLIPE